MKSEKAEKYLSENGLGYPYTGYVTEQTAERAAELAEQEAEERMRKKAVDVILIALGVWMFIDGYDNLQKK